MPTLPASGYATPQAPSVEPLPTAPGGLYDIKAPAEAFGGASAAALINLGTSIEKASANWERITDEHDKVNALDARTKADLAANTILYGNPEDSTSTGFFGLEGKAKLEARGNTVKSLRTIYEDAGKTLTPSAKRLYDQSTRGHRLGIEANIALDSVKALTEFRKQADAGAVKLKEQNADRLALTDDLDAWNVSVGEGVQLIQAAGERANKHPDVIEVEKNAFRAGRITEKAGALAERNPQAALDFIDRNSQFYSDPSMLEAIRGRAREKLEARQVDELAAPSGGTAPRGGGTGRGTGASAEHYNHLISIGATPNEATLLTSAAQAESNFNPEAKHDEATLAKKGLPPGYGLYGHNDKRLTEMQRQFGARPTWQQQNQFALAELRSRPEGAQVNVAKTPEELLEAQHRFEGYVRNPETDARRLGTTRELMRNAPRAPTSAPGPKAPIVGTVGTITGTDGSAYPVTEAESNAAPTLASEHARIDASPASQKVKDAAKARVNARYSQQTAIWEQTEDKYRRGIRDGDASITPEFLDAETDAGRLGPQQRQSLEAYSAAILKDQLERSNAIALVTSAKNGERVLDPTSADHRKAVDIDFDETRKGFAGLTGEEQWQRSLDYIGKTNVVPTPIKSLVNGNLYSGDVKRATEGARQYRDLLALNPMLAEGFNDDARAMAATVNTLAGLGMPEKDAFAQAQAQLRVPQAEQKARRESFDTVRGTTAKDRLDADTRAITSRHNTLLANDPNTIPDMMLHEFRELTQTFYGRTGNLDAAYQAAYDTMRGKWSPSQVGADGLRWLKGAPEALYGAPGRPDNTGWQNTQLLADVNATAPKPFTIDRLHIVPAPPETTKPGEKPGYFVWYFDEAGHWTYVQDANKQSLVWRPNWMTSSTRAQEAEDLRKRHEERARRPITTAPVPPVPQAPLPGDAPFLERLQRAPSQLRELRSPAPSGNRPPPT